MRRSARPWLVAFTAEGLNMSRFIRRAGEKGIVLCAVKRPSPRRMSALVREDQLPMLQQLAFEGGWEIVQGQRQGAGRMAEHARRRWLFWCAMMAGALALSLAAQVVWRIDIVDAGTYSVDIRSALTEMGVEAPLLRRSVDLGQLRDALAWRYPRIAWFECGWRGSALVIRAVEGVLPRSDEPEDGSCDVVANRDGIVHTIVTKAGTPVVQPGQIVRAGDVLIKGEERIVNGEVCPVAARGSVMARVWVGASVRIPAWEVNTTYTGREEIVWTVRTPWFDLWPMGESAFAQYDVSVSETPICGIFLPAFIRTERRMEAEITRHRLSMDALEADAYAAARRKLNEKVGGEESLIDIWGNCSMIDNENVLSVAIGEMLVDISLQQSSSGMAAPGQGNPE